MNRIILVGNGFDLAHNLKTRYENFINWYWNKWLKRLNSSTNQFEEDELFKIGAKYNSDCLCNYFYLGCTERNVYKHIEKVRQENGLSYIISPILKRISESIETKGWVDIEADYYAMLVKCKGKKDELERLNKDFAIIQGLLVRVGKEIYSIPIASVIESHRVKQGEIRTIDNYEVLNVRDEVISILRLNRLFGIKTESNDDVSFVVIVGSADKKIGVMVDALIGEEDVVIKPLHDQYTITPGIAGASILGDGSVSLIIDVSQLLDLGVKQELNAREEREAAINK